MAAKCLRAAAWAVVLFLAAGCEKIAEPQAAGQPPQATAGTDGQAAVGSQAVLDGSGSTDPEGGTLRYAWVQVSGPVAVGIRNADTARASALLSEAGEYLFRLTVTGGSGLNATDEVRLVAVAAPDGGGQASDVVDGPPHASAGLDVQVVVGSEAALDGSGSGDAEWSTLQYAWVQVSGPAAVAIQAAHAVQALVVPQQAGTYVFRLTVTDGSGLSATDEVRLVAAALPGDGGGSSADASPWASAGTDLRVTAGAEAVLDGGGSGDASKGALQYAWIQVSGPRAVGIRNADAERATAVLAEAGEYVFRLTVTNSNGRSATDEVRVAAGVASEPEPEPTPANGSLAVVVAPVPAGAVRVEYQLTAADLDTLRGELHIAANQTASVVIEQVRPGPDRRIEVYVHETDGRVERLGGIVVEVRESERVEVRIELAPPARAVGQLDVEGVIQPLPGYLESGNRALSLDGDGDFMRIGPSPALEFDPQNGDYTVELWLAVGALPSPDGDWQAVLGVGGDTGDALPFGLEIRAGGTGAALYGLSRNHEQDEIAVGPVQELVPVHVALVFRNGFVLSYWNGRLTGTVERRGGQVLAPGNYLVGAGADPAGEPRHFFKGQVDELRLWRRALSRQEIRTRMGGDLTGTEPDLAAYWRFDSLTPDGLVPDLSGHGLDGVLAGDAHLEQARAQH